MAGHSCLIFFHIMLIQSITEIAPTNEIAVIINVNTKLVTTLALMSTLKYAGMSVLVIDCESTDGSHEHFSELMRTYPFDILSVPLKKHGYTLDWLFKTIPAQKVLCVDSDVEILNTEVISMMKLFIDDDKTFGAGFIHGPSWLTSHHGIGFYQERPWIPLTFFKTALVRRAIDAGYSFIDSTIYNDFAPSAFISKLLHLRFRFSPFQNSNLSFLNPFKQSFYGLKPAYVYCDTGATLYQHLKYQCGYDFVGFPARFHERYASHFHGITRRLLDGKDGNSTKIDDVVLNIQHRLQSVYGISMTA
jgi:hypothetical protein